MGFPTSSDSSMVELVGAMGEWFVRVTEKDGSSQTRTFEHKDYAMGFAEGAAGAARSSHSDADL